MDRVNRPALQPVEFPGLTRVGCPDGDGGYVIPESLIRETTLLLSLGLGLNWTFDEDFLRRNPRARLIGIDHTVSPWMLARLFVVGLIKVPAYTFLGDRERAHKWADRLRTILSYRRLFAAPNLHLIKRVSDGSDPSDISLTAILAMVPPGSAPNVFVKMDIEGSEYDVVPDIGANQARIAGLAIEFHYIDRDPARFNDAIARLRQHFHIVHIHASDPGDYDDATGYAAFLEISFVNRALVTGSTRPATVTYPRPGLDVITDRPASRRTLRFT